MANSPPSPLSTPKRKRPFLADEDSDDGFTQPHASFSFNVSDMSAESVPTPGSSSPRTKVAHRFRGLALGDHDSGQSGGGAGLGSSHAARGGGTQPCDNDSTAAAETTERMQIDEDESKMRKRTRTSPVGDTADDAAASSKQRDPIVAEIPETADARRLSQNAAAHSTNSILPKPHADVPFALDTTLVTSSPKASPTKIARATPTATNRPLETLKAGNPKGRNKRAGTPPLTGTSTKTAAGNTDIIDPIRAALTWHDDEITVYDPEDEDDDGVGINGIGFKPTPAIAYARTMKRRQQLAEYRKREEKEARARRSHRRRGSPELPGKMERETSGGSRRVRFTETDPSVMIETI